MKTAFGLVYCSKNMGGTAKFITEHTAKNEDCKPVLFYDPQVAMIEAQNHANAYKMPVGVIPIAMPD